jgi:hypothetical protein
MDTQAEFAELPQFYLFQGPANIQREVSISSEPESPQVVSEKSQFQFKISDSH